MPKHILLFAATFILGALIALAARTATHDPHAQARTADAQTSQPLPSNHLHDANPAAAKPKTDGSDAKTKSQTSDASAPVNTVCAICGMAVDPKLPTLEYQGKKIGFGCRMCPPKFKANPDKYGPYYLRNEVIKR